MTLTTVECLSAIEAQLYQRVDLGRDAVPAEVVARFRGLSFTT